MKINMFVKFLVGLIFLLKVMPSLATVPLTLNTPPQAESAQDLSLNKRVRDELAKDAYLSKAAKNIKVSVLNGIVTLEGAVSRSSEKVRIEELALRVSQTAKVKNQIQVE